MVHVPGMGGIVRIVLSVMVYLRACIGCMRDPLRMMLVSRVMEVLEVPYCLSATIRGFRLNNESVFPTVTYDGSLLAKLGA